MRTWPVVAAVVLAGCGTFSNNDAAADVDGTEISRDEYEQLLGNLTTGTAPVVQSDPVTGTLDGATGRQLLDFLIVNTASADFVAAAGEPVTDEDRAAARETLEQTGQTEQFAPEVVDVLVEREATRAALARVAAGGDLQARYEASPTDVGVLCLRHILVESEEEAEAGRRRAGRWRRLRRAGRRALDRHRRGAERRGPRAAGRASPA